MRTRGRTALALLLTAAVASGCGELKISPTAVHEIAGVADNPGLKDIALSSGDVSRLARQAGVEDQVIRDAAPDLDSSSLWSGSLEGVRRVYEQTPAQVRSNLVGIACDGFNGRIASRQDLEQNVLDRLQVESQGELAAYVDSVAGLWQELYDAADSGDPQLKAQAALTCFTVEQAVG